MSLSFFKLLAVSAVALSASSAYATCNVADYLIERYGVSFSGFRKEIPRAPNPAELDAKVKDAMIIRLQTKKIAYRTDLCILQ